MGTIPTTTPDVITPAWASESQRPEGLDDVVIFRRPVGSVVVEHIVTDHGDAPVAAPVIYLGNAEEVTTPGDAIDLALALADAAPVLHTALGARTPELGNVPRWAVDDDVEEWDSVEQETGNLVRFWGRTVDAFDVLDGTRTVQVDVARREVTDGTTVVAGPDRIQIYAPETEGLSVTEARRLAAGLIRAAALVDGISLSAAADRP